ncbi:MAG: S1/P1 nuclease [Woeseiaceae bacterium]
MPKHRSLLLLLLVTTGLALPLPAFAWGKTGHRVSAQIAEAFLSDLARGQIREILGEEDLAEASTWPDFMRSSRDEFWDSTADPFHYVTIPHGKTYAEVGAPEQGDAVTALAGFRETLLDHQASLADKQLALRFIVHVVADLHQPLHAGNGTDQGGNSYTVTFFGRTTNLHSVWDTALVDDEKLSYTEMTAWLLRRMTPENVAGWHNIDPVLWADESAAIRDGIYPDGDREIRFDYIFAHRETVRTRLMMGGVRLAAYLNEVFGSPPMK